MGARRAILLWSVVRVATMDASSVGEIDGWIEKLYNCKPLSEQEIRRLCEKVRETNLAVPFLGSVALSRLIFFGGRESRR